MTQLFLEVLILHQTFNASSTVSCYPNSLMLPHLVSVTPTACLMMPQCFNVVQTIYFLLHLFYVAPTVQGYSYCFMELELFNVASTVKCCPNCITVPQLFNATPNCLMLSQQINVAPTV
jgi:hypothetical protein